MDAPNKGGRPVTVGGKKVLVYLDPAAHIKARLLGSGNVSAGVRAALAASPDPTAPATQPNPKAST